MDAEYIHGYLLDGSPNPEFSKSYRIIDCVSYSDGNVYQEVPDSTKITLRNESLVYTFTNIRKSNETIIGEVEFYGQKCTFEVHGKNLAKNTQVIITTLDILNGHQRQLWTNKFSNLNAKCH